MTESHQDDARAVDAALAELRRLRDAPIGKREKLTDAIGGARYAGATLQEIHTALGQ